MSLEIRMPKTRTMNCRHCGKEFERTHPSTTLHCSFQCRFLEIAAQFQGVEGCWEWPRSVNPVTGYGQMTARVDGKTILLTAHRLSFQLLGGGIPSGQQVLHRCDNRKCFNPVHLFDGTQKDNIADMIAKDRRADQSLMSRSGEEHWAKRTPERIPRGTAKSQAKLTEAQVKEIRAAKTGYGTGAALARKYGVGESLISAIRKGSGWKHVA